MELPHIETLPHEEESTVDTGLTVATVVTLVLAAGLATAGQLLLKAGMNDIGTINGIGPSDLAGLIGSVLTTWKTLLGLACFGASSLFWLVVLSRVPLSVAYPFVALSYLIILGFSVLVLRERPPLVTWAGASLIMTGIVMIGVGGFDRGT